MSTQPDKKTDVDLQNVWKTQIAKEYAPLRETHTLKEYTFTQDEGREFIRLVSIQAFAKEIVKIAEGQINQTINTKVLPRVGVPQDPNTKVLYEATIGRFAVFAPKNLASVKKPAKKTPEKT